MGEKSSYSKAVSPTSFNTRITFPVNTERNFVDQRACGVLNVVYRGLNLWPKKAYVSLM